MIRFTPLLLVCAAFVVGCSGSSTTDTSNNSTTPGTSDGGAKIKVVFIPKNTGNPYFKPLSAGFEEASKTLGFDYQEQGPATGDATSQIPIIKDQIQRKVDVIAVAANAPDTLNEVLDDAKAKGILVITVDADLTGNESHRAASILPASPIQIGKSQFELLAKQMKYEGEFAILSATTTASNQNAWIEAAKEAMKDAKYAKMKLVETVFGDDDSQKSSTEMEGLLTKHPNLKGVWSPTSVGLSAAAQVLENLGMYPGGPKAVGGGVHLTGLSTPNQLKKFVAKGVIEAFQLWDPKEMGLIGAQLAFNSRKGKLELKSNSEVEGPKGKLKIDDKGVVFAGDLLTFDKTNIDKYDF